MSKNLTKRAEDYSKWYNELVVKADLAENSGVRGCMVIKPYGYAIWENILHYCSETQQNGYFDVRRAEQSKYWMYETIDEQLRNHFYQSQKENLKIAEKQVMSNQVSSFAVAFELLDNYFNTNK